MSAVLRRMSQVFSVLAVLAASLFLSAGRTDWPMAWALVGLYAMGVAINATLLARYNPELIEERSRIQRGGERWDRVPAAVVGIFGPLAVWIVAGLDRRFGWSPPIPLSLQIAALVLAALGFAVLIWAMVSNRFFSALVRIQKERGHTAVTHGPYGYVRHPGYLGLTVLTLAAPVLLGTLLALIPAGLTTAVTIVRTVLEDRTLRRELEGYEEYSRRVRYRLLPGLW